jgi:putative membrane protein
MLNGNGNWNDGMGHGNWWWIPMVIMMVVVWGGLIWIGVTLLKRNHTGAPPVMASPKAAAEQLLADRLARGDIELDDYRQRIEALRTPHNAGQARPDEDA